MSGMRHVAILAVLAMAVPAAAQDSRLNVQTINFDLWCQETQHLPADRCDKRLQQDEAAFEDYRAKVEKYEVPYLEGQQTGAQLNRTILHADPVDHPVDKDPAAASQQPVSPAEPPQP